MNNQKVIRVGTRKSKLALVQTEHVVALLQARFPDIKFEIVAMSTTGDNILNMALFKIGEKSLFTKELEICLEEGQVDLVVHSLKDLPTVLPKNMVIGAVLEREDPRDAVIVRQGLACSSLSELSPSSVVGTSSVRRRAQLIARFPHLIFADIRGNLNTRFKKLDESGDDDSCVNKYSAIILAAAGVKRMGWQERITQLLSYDDCLHAVGQGAIAVEVREGDEDILKIVWTLTDLPTTITCIAERAVMRTLEGGCSAPVAAHGDLTDGILTLTAGVWSLDGKEQRKEKEEVKLPDDVTQSDQPVDRRTFSSIKPPDDIEPEILLHMSLAEQLGITLSSKLLHDGAREILAKARLENQQPSQT